MTHANATVDSDQRLQALDIHRSFCVQAPAGSGKTELLTQRILKLLAHCDQPESVLAITFTRKAAAEMRSRLLENLKTAQATSDEELKNLPDHKQLTLTLAKNVLTQSHNLEWNLLENPARLHITTIDSFNHSLASQLPLLSSFGAKPEITDDPEKLYSEAILALLQRLEEGSTLSDSLATLLEHLDNNFSTLQRLLNDLLYKREQWLEHILLIQHDSSAARQYLHNSLVSLVSDALQHLNQQLGARLPALIEAMHYAHEQMVRLDITHPLSESLIPETLTTDPECLSYWQMLCSLILTGTGSLRKTVNVKSGFPVDGDDKNSAAEMKQIKQNYLALIGEFTEDTALLESLNQVAILPPATYKDSHWSVLDALTTVLYHLSAELTLVFQRHNQCDYSQVSAAALQALGSEQDPSSTALRLDYQLKHILVDEFQDTSSLQLHLLQKLTREWNNEDERSLFIVGDGMQSCYGFRNANVGLFLAARDHGIGALQLDSLQLQVNFRSEVAVVDWVNRHFSQAFPQQDDIGRGAVSYNESIGIHTNEDNAGVELIIQEFNKQDEPDTAQIRLLEAKACIETIVKIQQNDPEAGIAILIRSRNHISELLPELKAANIAWNASEIDSLSSYSDIQDLMTLLAALLNPADSTAWLALLRCPFIGLNIADIHTFAVYANDQKLCLCQALLTEQAPDGISKPGISILSRVVPLLQQARKARGRQGLRPWLEHTWYALGGPAALLPTIDDSHLEAFFSLLEKEEHAGDLSDTQSLHIALNKLYVNSKLNPEANVQIMTLHKSKGLEFDYVMIPRLNDRGRADQGALLQWQEYVSEAKAPQLLMSIPAAKGADSDPLHKFLSKESAHRSTLETTRLLYIGVTRAIKKAYLFGSLIVDQDKPKATKAQSNSLLACLWESLIPLEDNATIHRPLLSKEDQPAHVKASAETSGKILSRSLSADWSHPCPPKQSLLSELSTEESLVTESGDTQSDKKEEQAFTPTNNNLAERTRGDIIHESLCQAAQGEFNLRDDQAHTARKPYWLLRLGRCTVSPEEYIKQIEQQLQQVADSSQAQWILDSSHSESQCELSLSDYGSEWRQESIIDRTFVDNDGIRWIIDYKSSSPEDTDAIEAFLTRESEQYKEQLDRYAKIFTQLEPDRVCVKALYFPAIDVLHTLP